jgi:hypothetical protein
MVMIGRAAKQSLVTRDQTSAKKVRAPGSATRRPL